MNTSGRTVTKNASILMVSQLITWGLSFVMTIAMSRYLGPVGIGQLELGNSLWAILASLAALGTDTYLIREFASSEGRLDTTYSTTLALRMVLYLIGSIGMVIYVLLAGYPADTVAVILIIGLSFIFGQITGTFESALKGLERMEYSSLAWIVFIFLLTIMRFGLIALGWDVFAFAATGIVANLVSLVIMAYFFHKVYGLRLKVDLGLVRPVLQASIPFFLVGIALVLYHHVDTVIISLLVDEKNVGWYSIADRLFGTLLFLPNVLGTALFPALSRAYAETKSLSHDLSRKSMNMLLVVGVPIGLGTAAIANPVVSLMFGPEFANSGPVLAVRGVVMILTYINMLLGYSLIVMERQRIWAIVILIAAVLTVPLDLLFIPLTNRMFANGALGGALSFTVTEIFMTIIALRLLPKGTFTIENVKSGLRTLLAGLGMAGAAWLLRNQFIAIPIAVGGLVYAGLILALRALPKDDWDYFMGIGSSVFQRVRARFSRAS